MSISQEREQLLKKTFHMMFRVALIFGIPAIMAYFIGSWVDGRWNIRPYGTLSVLAVAFITSWAFVIHMYIQLDQQFRNLREREQREEQTTQEPHQEEKKNT